MRTYAITLLLASALAGVSFAEDEAAPAEEMKRGFADGKFVDEYFDIAYAAPELQQAFGAGGSRVLWAGRCAGDVDVKLHCTESPKPLSAKDWRARWMKAWSEDGRERKDMEQGADPEPWVLFVQPSLAGFQQHHGYAFYARGPQCFVVHASVGEKSDTSTGAIRNALGGLKVGPRQDSYLLAHVVAKLAGGSPLDPALLVRAGADYASEQVGDHPRAIEVLLLAKETGWDGFDGIVKWQLLSLLGFSQLTAGRHEAAIQTWKQAVELMDGAPPEAAASKSHAHYNLACAYARAGRTDDAFKALGKAFEGPADAIAGLRKHAQNDPDLASLRAEAEKWKALFP